MGKTKKKSTAGGKVNIKRGTRVAKRLWKVATCRRTSTQDTGQGSQDEEPIDKKNGKGGGEKKKKKKKKYLLKALVTKVAVVGSVKMKGSSATMF